MAMTRRLLLALTTTAVIGAALALFQAPVWVCLVGAGWVGLFMVPYVATGVRTVCGHSSCPGMEDDPEFPALVCSLPRGHRGMHRQAGVSCAWERPVPSCFMPQLRRRG